MNIEDFELIKDILISDFDDFWKPETLRSELMNSFSKYIVAKDNQNNILGFAGIWNALYDFHITNIVVRKDLRNTGIGTVLLEKLIEIAKFNKMETITLEVMCTNTHAIRLYEKFGFKNAGIRKNYYKRRNVSEDSSKLVTEDSQGEDSRNKGTCDAFIMTKNLL